MKDLVGSDAVFHSKYNNIIIKQTWGKNQKGMANSQKAVEKSYLFFNFQFKSALISFLVCSKCDLFVLITWAATSCRRCLWSLVEVDESHPSLMSPVKSHRKSTFSWIILTRVCVRKKRRESRRTNLMQKRTEGFNVGILKHRRRRCIVTTGQHTFDTGGKKDVWGQEETNRDMWGSIRESHTVILRGRWRREIVQVEQRGCWLYGTETASWEDGEKTERGRQTCEQTWKELHVLQTVSNQPH